jgi:hypothetical protein
MEFPSRPKAKQSSLLDKKATFARLALARIPPQLCSSIAQHKRLFTLILFPLNNALQRAKGGKIRNKKAPRDSRLFLSSLSLIKPQPGTRQFFRVRRNMYRDGREKVFPFYPKGLGDNFFPPNEHS